MKKILEGREGTILKLNKIFSLGYTPSRGGESYKTRLVKNDVVFIPYPYINCFEHACFNLTNQQLIDIDFNMVDRASFTTFYPNIFTPKFMVKDKLLNFVEATGLKVNRSRPDAKLKNHEWLVSLYFGYNSYPDFHFILKEKDGSWSSKLGFTSEVEQIESHPDSRYNQYTYYNTYKISNPHAKHIITTEK